MMLRWTEEQMREYHAKRQGKKGATAEAQAHQKDQPRAKYRNKKTHINGQTFDSKLEAGRFCALKMQQEAGLISELKTQVSFSLVVNEHLVCRYVADFTYKDCDGKTIVEDAKGIRTKDYILKKKLMLACHGIEVREFRKERSRARKP